MKVRVKREVWENFTEWTIKKHGSKFAMLGMELENALQEYISNEKRERKSEMKPKRNRAIDRIEERIAELGIDEQENIPIPVVQRIIEEEAGIDPRTVKRYFTLLEHDMILPEGSGNKARRVW